jgi:hypothetical protein
MWVRPIVAPFAVNLPQFFLIAAHSSSTSTAVYPMTESVKCSSLSKCVFVETILLGLHGDRANSFPSVPRTIAKTLESSLMELSDDPDDFVDRFSFRWHGSPLDFGPFRNSRLVVRGNGRQWHSWMRLMNWHTKAGSQGFRKPIQRIASLFRCPYPDNRFLLPSKRLHEPSTSLKTGFDTILASAASSWTRQLTGRLTGIPASIASLRGDGSVRAFWHRLDAGWTLALTMLGLHVHEGFAEPVLAGRRPNRSNARRSRRLSRYGVMALHYVVR